MPDYSTITQEEFDSTLAKVLGEKDVETIFEYGMVESVLREELNNSILQELRPDGDYSNLPESEFQDKLEEMVGGMSGGQLLAISGVYEEVSEELNNEVLEILRPSAETIHEQDSTKPMYLCRYEAGDATVDDHIDMAWDSYLNGQLKDAAEYIGEVSDRSQRLAAARGLLGRIDEEYPAPESRLGVDDVPTRSEIMDQVLEEKGVYEHQSQSESLG